MSVDNIFNKLQHPVPPFEFNEKVAQVFDDMISRSVPCYREVIRRQVQMISMFYKPGTCIYDLGCSNGNTGIGLCEVMGCKPFTMIGVDNSRPMLDLYRKSLEPVNTGGDFELLCRNIEDVPMANASVVIINFTLQFLPVSQREKLLRRAYDALIPGGVLLFSEKIIHEDPSLAELDQEFYFQFKRENGYSDLEISQKREALENVLIPETVETHKERIRKAGFKEVNIWMKWFNFISVLCLKQPAVSIK